MDCYSDVEIGLDEEAVPIAVNLHELSVLIGGAVGSQKSGVQAVMAAAAALDPTTSSDYIDGKEVELALWRHCAAGYVGLDIAQANTMLLTNQADMMERYNLLNREGRRRIQRGDGFGLRYIFIDELEWFTNHPDRKAAEVFTMTLRDIIRRGRACGYVVVATCIKPTTDSMSSALSGAFGYRIAMRCTTREQSDAILGSNWSSQGHSAADIPIGSPGIGLLLHETGIPVTFQSYWLNDAKIAEIAARGAVMRGMD